MQPNPRRLPRYISLRISTPMALFELQNPVRVLLLFIALISFLLQYQPSYLHPSLLPTSIPSTKSHDHRQIFKPRRISG